MTKQEFIGASGILLPGAITIPKGGEIAISQDWLIFPDAITGEGKVWTIDGLLEPCIKPDNEVWVDSNVENPFAGPITYKGKNKYGWLIGEIPADVTNELDFIDRKSVRNIILSNYVTEIPDKAFFGCDELQYMIISNSVLRIGNVAFYNCSRLQTLTIPDTVIEMGGGIFCDCCSLKSIKLPNTLTHLDHYLYTSEEGDLSLDMGFFQSCHNLLTILLPLTLQSIGNLAFYNCNALTSVSMGNGVTTIGAHAFEWCNSLRAFAIPDNVTTIGVNTFFQCHSLTSVTIPNSVTSIEDGAFLNCSSLTTITIPGSVTRIGYDAFDNTPLQRIVSYAETPPTIEWNTFENVDKSIPLEVPNADLYREAPYWQEFYTISNINPYQLNVSSNNEEWGYIRILEHNTNRSVIEAYYKDGYAFKQWSDGNTDIWRELNITEDTTLVALFGEPYKCEIVNLEVIDSTPTSVTVRFEVTCNEERDTLNSVLACINNGEFCGSVVNKPGVLETLIEGLQPETMYQIRVSAMNDAYYWIDRYIEFTTPSNPQLYNYVDLGLPSGTLWADKNIGAENPWDNGLYFSWGNVDGHAVDENGNVTDDYSFDSTTYSTTSGGQYTGSTLDGEHDAATANMGEEWRMPTSAETVELVNGTTQTVDAENGVMIFTSKTNGNSIFIPFAGRCGGSLLGCCGTRGYVWLSSLNESLPSHAHNLYYLDDGFVDGGSYGDRYFGRSVRGVKNN